MQVHPTRLGRYETTAVAGAAVRAYVPILGIVRETTGRQCGKVFIYGAFMDLLSEGTDPLPR